jgi:dihydroflavonol-4-reductase
MRGTPPGSFSVVDARDVAACEIAAAERGGRGQRYLAAGRHMTMAELFALLEKVSSVPAPTRRIPIALLYTLAVFYEAYARITGRPVLSARDNRAGRAQPLRPREKRTRTGPCLPPGRGNPH